MNSLLYIVWDPSPELFSVFDLDVRWYGLLFALGFLIGQQIMFYLYREEGKPAQDVETLTIYMVLAVIIGARLGHVFFYEPEKYLSDPIEILNIRGGGLASHGAAIGILTALFLYVNFLIRIHKGKFEFKKRRRPGQSYLWVVDKVVIVTAFIGALIRIGNFMNSEIVGEPTGTDYGVVYGYWLENATKLSGDGYITSVETFKETGDKWQDKYTAPVRLEIEFQRNIDTTIVAHFIRSTLHNMMVNGNSTKEFFNQPASEPLPYTLKQRSGVVTANVIVNGVPLHPTQLYEAASYMLVFIILFLIWYRKKRNTPEGLIFGVFLITLWSFRFLWEFWKAPQVDFEQSMSLNMGQWLSIPLILAGIVILIYSLKNKKADEENVKVNP